MLEFRYDFRIFVRILRPRSFRAIEMDTDSFYMALTETDLPESFTEVAKTQMQENAKHFQEQDDCYLPNAQLNFLSRSCSREHAAIDRKTSGLFKIEWKGNGNDMAQQQNLLALKKTSKK